MEVLEPLYDGDVARWIEHPSLGVRADIAALPLTRTEGVLLRPVSLALEDDAVVCRPTEAVSVIGFPFGQSGPGQFAIWATGFIASEPEFLYNGLPVMLIDCRTRAGQSGAPVIAYRIGYALVEDGPATALRKVDGAVSRFLRVYGGRIRPDSDLGMVWRESAIQELVEFAESRAPAR